MGTKRTMSHVCNKRGWAYEFKNNTYHISTGYELFCVQMYQGIASITSRCVLGGKNELNEEKLDITIDPATNKNIAANIERAMTIHNDDEFCKYWYNIIQKQCKQLHITSEIKFGIIYIRTAVEEFYIEPDFNNPTKFDLFHRGRKAWGPDTNQYHRQKKDGLTYGNVVQYIAQHTLKKYGNIKKGSYKA